ncbi:MAG: hypothetical protein QOK05_905 [Chloroflexota bacterium]|nr:hypothetical protein [Chloroflexota bacterium]
MPDADGYGYGSADRGVARLLEDLRTLSPAGIERIAAGWDRHVAGEDTGHERFHEAEHVALHAVEAADIGPAWEDLRRQILDLTEGRQAMNDWKVEHGDIGHKAEAATLAAALALTAPDLPQETHDVLVAPMAEALPWLRA